MKHQILTELIQTLKQSRFNPTVLILDNGAICRIQPSTKEGLRPNSLQELLLSVTIGVTETRQLTVNQAADIIAAAA